MTHLIVPTKTDCALDQLLSENMQLEAQVATQEQTIAQLERDRAHMSEMNAQRTSQLDQLAAVNVELDHQLSKARGMLRVQGQELTQRRCAIKDLQIERDRLHNIVKAYDALMNEYRMQRKEREAAVS